ncbi:MAG: 2-dehydropantoate 2-reductase [Proteobacteria bacterium]|nr:2-dehydropantoate 2-reductase [Pseudomonadota bacterium]NIS72404.1 2-dehydropantoate 2-reductase [Pseudomonadota bacterium]
MRTKNLPVSIELGERAKIAVVGAGAIGGVTAAFLVRAGWDLEIVCKHQEIVERASRGLHVFGAKGDYRVPLRAVKDIADLSGPKDVVFLATKAYDCLAAVQDLLPFLGQASAVVSLQNGMCEHALAEVLGRERVVGCVVGWGATMHGPGELEVTSRGEFVIGNIDNEADRRLPFLQEMLRAVMPTRISENIVGELYSKLVVNSCINSLGVIAGLRLGELLANRKVRYVFLSLMGEAMAVAEAMGIKVEPGGAGKVDYDWFLRGQGTLAELTRHVLIRIIGLKYRKIKSSSLQSLERGRMTEIDYLNGYICGQGKKHGVPTPINDGVVKMIKEIEGGKRRITPENLNDPVFDLP